MLKSKQLTSFLLIIVIFSFFYFFSDKPTEAGSTFVNGFGGRVTMKMSCTCSSGYQVTIQGPGQSSGTYLESPGTRLYKNNFMSPGRNVVGTYNPGGICLVTAYPKCKELKISKGTINISGVSF